MPFDLSSLLDLAETAPPHFALAVASDADGTIWEGDVGDTLFAQMTAQDAFRGEGLERLRAYTQRAFDPALANASGKDMAEAWTARYFAGGVTPAVMCTLEAETVGDREGGDWEAWVSGAVSAIAPRVRPEARAVFEAAYARGWTVHVVTGSLTVLVERTLLRAGLPFASVSGAVLVPDSTGGVTATLATPPPLYEGKVAALTALGKLPARIGMGDGVWDQTFLRETFVPVLMHPTAKLREAMEGVPRALTVA